MHVVFRILATIVSTIAAFMSTLLLAQIPQELRPSLDSPQEWSRDTDGPVLSIGETGEFDDMHIFAPAVAAENGGYRLWYCGSTGAVTKRVFRLGTATAPDGKSFRKYADNPVFTFGDGKHSILTPTLLQEAGKLRMWFSSTWFDGGAGRHTLHESLSEDGVTWSAPSPALLADVYAPTIIRTGTRCGSSTSLRIRGSSATRPVSTAARAA